MSRKAPLDVPLLAGDGDRPAEAGVLAGEVHGAAGAVDPRLAALERYRALGAGRGAPAAARAPGGVVVEHELLGPRLGVRAPPAAQRAALHENRRADAGAVVGGEAGDLGNDRLFHAFHPLHFVRSCVPRLFYVSEGRVARPSETKDLV